MLLVAASQSLNFFSEGNPVPISSYSISTPCPTLVRPTSRNERSRPFVENCFPQSRLSVGKTSTELVFGRGSTVEHPIKTISETIPKSDRLAIESAPRVAILSTEVPIESVRAQSLTSSHPERFPRPATQESSPPHRASRLSSSAAWRHGS